jgi:hypothetical protein
MKRNFWIGLLIGSISGLLLITLVGAVAAQSRAAVSPTNAQTLGITQTLNLSAPAQPTGGGGPYLFTYQGLLKKNGAPVNGSCDMRFSLFDSYGTQQGTTITFTSVLVNNGLFTVAPNFGNQYPGDTRYLQIQVACPPGSAYSAFDLQSLTATPYALGLKPGAIISGTTAPALEIYANSAAPGSIALSVNNLVSDNWSTAIYGSAWTGRGVVGYSLASTGTGVGVWGITNSPTGTGIAAQGSGAGAALALHAGNIKVVNAGVGTHTPVFIHKVNTAANICDIQNYSTVIDNSLINGNPDAILIVTPNYGAKATGTAPAVGIPAVYYDAANECGKGAGRWVIYNLNSTPQTNNSLFNVMAVIP